MDKRAELIIRLPARGSHGGEKGGDVQYSNMIGVDLIRFEHATSLQISRTMNYIVSARGVRFVMQMKEFHVGD
jgi:hypothetical protein